MIFHISSRVASRSTSALLSPVPLTGCPAADTWSQRNQRPSSTSPPIPHRRVPNTTARERRTQQTAGDPTEGHITLRQYNPFIRAEGVSHAQGGVLQQLLQMRAVLPKSLHKRKATEG